MLIKEIRNKINLKLTKTCKICGESESNKEKCSDWIHPCDCKGSLLWCHESCLKTWFKYSNSEKCSICLKKLNIVYKNKYLKFLKDYLKYIIFYTYIFLVFTITSYITPKYSYYFIFIAHFIRRFVIVSNLIYLFLYFLFKKIDYETIENLDNILFIHFDIFLSFRETKRLIYNFIEKYFNQSLEIQILNGN